MRKILALLALGGFACAKPDQSAMQQGAPADSTPAVRAAIEAGNSGLIAAIEKGDSLAAASFYDPQAMAMPNGMDAAVGRENIVKMFGAMSSMNVTNMKLEIHDVVASGDLAVETGHYEWTLTPPKGKPTTDKGKYVVAWRKQPDGSWKLFRDIFNNDAPPAKPMSK